MSSRRKQRRAVAQCLAQLRLVLGDDLNSVILYGSQARGDAVEGSDIDVLIVLKQPFDYGCLLDRTSEATAAVSLECDVVLSRVFVTRDDLDRGRSPFLAAVRREGIPF